MAQTEGREGRSQIPHPVVDGDSRPYWEAVARGELLIQRCDACGRTVFYPRWVCPHCSADRLVWERASGQGTVYSYTVVHQAYGPFAGQSPFVIALVDLDEGVRMLTRLKGEPEVAKIGARVRVVFERVDDELTLPHFEIVE
jgi:uncharacterized OB-fold protein